MGHDINRKVCQRCNNTANRDDALCGACVIRREAEGELALVRARVGDGEDPQALRDAVLYLLDRVTP